MTHGVVASVGLVSSSVDTIRYLQWRFHSFDTSRVWLFGSILFSIPSRSIYHARTFIPRENRANISIVQNGFYPNDNSGIQRFSHLDIPTKY